MPGIRECIIENAASATKEVKKKEFHRHTLQTHTQTPTLCINFYRFYIKIVCKLFRCRFVSHFPFGQYKRNNTVTWRRRRRRRRAGEMSEFVRNEQSYTTHAYSVCNALLHSEWKKLCCVQDRARDRERERACETGSWWKWENR